MREQTVTLVLKGRFCHFEKWQKRPFNPKVTPFNTMATRLCEKGHVICFARGVGGADNTFDEVQNGVIQFTLSG